MDIALTKTTSILLHLQPSLTPPTAYWSMLSIPAPHRDGSHTSNQSTIPTPQRAHHTTQGRKGGGFFKNLRGDTANTQPFSWESSNHSNLHLFSKLQTTFNRDYSWTLHSLSYSNPRSSTASNPLMGTIAHLLFLNQNNGTKAPNVTSTSLHVII